MTENIRPNACIGCRHIGACEQDPRTCGYWNCPPKTLDEVQPVFQTRFTCGEWEGPDSHPVACQTCRSTICQVK